MKIMKIVLTLSFIFLIFSITPCGEVRCQERSVNPVTLNWDQTSEDYSKYRPGYPDDYFLLLQKLGIGLKNQDILDIGTGTGALALPFAKQGAHVTGVDISKGQIEAAKTLASQKKLNVRFIVAKAEETNLPDKSFDVITASMCWGYLDQKRQRGGSLRPLHRRRWRGLGRDGGFQSVCRHPSHPPRLRRGPLPLPPEGRRGHLRTPRQRVALQR